MAYFPHAYKKVFIARSVDVAGGTGSDGKIAIDDFSRMKFAFDKAKVPVEYRVAIVSPDAETQLNKLLQITEPTDGSVFNYNVDGLVQEGFGNKLRVVRKLFGFDNSTCSQTFHSSADDGRVPSS